jgi:hypothetical protein
MKIGEDYPKIEWDFMGFQLLEPNAFIGDTIIAIVAFILFYKARRIYKKSKNSYNLLWMWFFMVFGIGFFAGGLGHLLYNYLGIFGKYGAWYIGILSSFLLELAMVSQLYKHKFLLEKIVVLKAVLSLLLLTALIISTDLSSSPLKGLVIPTINSFIGLLFALAYLGYQFTKTKSKGFRFLYWSILVLLPTVLFQGMKINFHPWLDRNDVSHLLIIITLILYYTSLRKVQKVVV